MSIQVGTKVSVGSEIGRVAGIRGYDRYEVDMGGGRVLLVGKSAMKVVYPNMAAGRPTEATEDQPAAPAAGDSAQADASGKADSAQADGGDAVRPPDPPPAPPGSRVG